MKADERKDLEQNTLVKDTRLLVEGVKSGKFLNYRIIGLVLAVAIVGGVWWYAIRQSRTSTSAQWAQFAQSQGAAPIEVFAEENQKDFAGKVARLQLARLWFGPDGVAQLNASDPEKRTKGIDNIQKARDEFVKLADEFKDDQTLRAASLIDAAGAELALVGIPKATGSSEERGTVAKAVEFYRQAASTVGEETEYGGKLKAKADELEKDAAEIHKVAQALYNPLLPTGGDPHGFGGPRAPSSLSPAPTIPDPTNPAKADTPKAPDSLTAPPVTPTPEPKKEATPPAPTPKGAPPPAPAPSPTPSSKK